MNKLTLSVLVVVAAVIAVVLLLFSTRERVPPEPPDMGNVLAVVNDWVLDIDEMDRQMEQLPPHTRALRDIDPDRFVAQMVDRHLLIREAERRGIQNTDLYEEFYAENPGQPESHHNALIQAMVQLEIRKLPPLTVELMRETFDARPDDFLGLDFERHQQTIRDLMAHERDVLRALEFMEELRNEAQIAINHRVRDVLLGQSTP